MWINNIRKIDYLSLKGIEPIYTDNYGAYYNKTLELSLLLDSFDIRNYYIKNELK